MAGMGIGGQYAAINSAIDEMMPSKYRGRVDIWINGSYWAGAILGSFVAYVFLNNLAGVQAVGKSLEAVTKPLTSTDQGSPTATVTPISCHLFVTESPHPRQMMTARA